MARPKTTGHRRGGRNKQFFDGLSGLASAKNARAPDKTKWNDEQMSDDAVSAAEAKRKRKAYARLRNSGLIPKEAK